jgi:hypothetical protein
MNEIYLVKGYELLISSPERVYNVYKEFSNKEGRTYETLFKNIEQRLLEKNDPLITLALANYGLCRETIECVFEKALNENLSELKLACLSYNPRDNAKRNPILFPNAKPPCLFDIYYGKEVNQKILFLLQSFNYHDVYALFQNPNIHPKFLQDFLMLGDYWNALHETLQEIAIEYLSVNEIIKGTDKELLYEIWMLAARVEPTLKWAKQLLQIYENVNFMPAKIDESIVKRWILHNLTDDETNELSPDGGLSTTAQLRYHLYRTHFKTFNGDAQNFLSNREKENPSFTTEHPDLAHRAAQYHFLDLTSGQIYQAYEKDGDVACFFMLKNQNIWRRKTTRNALEKVSNDFCFEEIGFKKSNPEWFSYRDEDNYEPDDETLTVGKLKGLLKLYKDQIVNETRNQVRDLLASHK